ncbi:ATP-binding response regulator [Halobellus ruber]|uniref:histidine kinase n=1 Tax=Halobellus ruber TaxID=2761102 RepID=A0A7J9SFX5_9EURY|nr:response regulator [Halobellus ruber]MBB6645412.1 response regulator [Halobellus ruber]
MNGTEHRYRTGQTRLLHVDDDRAFLDVTEAFLTRELPSVDVTTVERPAAAIERLRDESLDCVVSDYEMPDLDGLELLSRVRERYPELPFLLYTGKGSESIASRAINAGVTGYLQKGGPEQHERLANRVQHAIREYHAGLDRERYSAVLQALGYPTYVVDAEGRFAYVDEAFAELTGYDREELVGVEPALIKTDESVEKANDALRSVVSSSGPDAEQFEIEIRTKNGDLIPCRDHIAPLPFDEEYRGCAGILRDITSQRRRREELARQNERLEEFISVASHDLRTPLTTARTAAELARETGESEFFDRLEDAHDRFERMLDELLTLAREGDDVAATEPTDLGTVARTAWESVGTDGAEFSVVSPPTVEANTGRTRRLLENLLRNAVVHADEGVKIEIGSLDDRAGFYVADDGPGIPPDARESVFEPGYTTAEAGNGFGLAIVSRIAAAHGWDVTLTDSEDGGARFEFAGVEPSAESAEPVDSVTPSTRS